MRIIAKSRSQFYGTHKGYEIEIIREYPPFETLKGVHHFYIRVFNDNGYAYDGYAPVGINTMAGAKREALYGACLKDRPIPTQKAG